MNLIGCKQVTASDVISGWNFSGPLANQIRRKDGSPVAIAQSGQDVPSRFGVEGGTWTRCAWEKKYRHVITGWSNRYALKVRERIPNAWAIRFDSYRYFPGLPEWYTTHQP